MTPICQYVSAARDEMRAGANIDRWIELRYYIMAKECPHDTFSVEQASLTFFETAHNHIWGLEDMPKSVPNRPLSVYDLNYIKWIKQAQAEPRQPYKLGILFSLPTWLQKDNIKLAEY